MSDSNAQPYNTTDALARLKAAEEERLKKRCRNLWVSLPGDHPMTFEVAWTNEWAKRFREDPRTLHVFAGECDRRRRLLPRTEPS